MILDTSTVDADVQLQADVCVVGSGAGGAVAAAELAEAGYSVVLVEDGPYLRSSDFVQREEVMYPRLYREGGTKATADYTVLVSQGRAVGGSTVASFCLCVRPPRPLLAYWAHQLGLPGLEHEAMHPYFRQVERRIGAQRVLAEQVNGNSARLQQGSERLGYRGYLPLHNRTDCLATGFCALGCTYDRKGDMLTTYVPAASRAGALVVPDCQVTQVLVEQGRAGGVSGVLSRSRTGTAFGVQVKAKVVVLAAGAINSPRIWRQSKLPDPADVVGRNLRLQPQVVVTALYSEPIESWKGIPQGYVVDEFLDVSGRSVGSGYLLVPAFAHPVAAASMLPGYGAEHRELMALYPRLGAIAVLLHDHTRGRLEFEETGPPAVSYRLGTSDEERLMDALEKACDISFAAGAEKVFLPYNQVVSITKRGAYQVIRDRGVRVNDPLFLSYQPQGTLRMGTDPRKSVVDSHGESHGVRGLFVTDASVFPTSVAVPAQMAVMALATRTAQHIHEQADKYF